MFRSLLTTLQNYHLASHESVHLFFETIKVRTFQTISHVAVTNTDVTKLLTMLTSVLGPSDFLLFHFNANSIIQPMIDYNMSFSHT